MEPKEFIHHLDEKRILSAINEAEQHTSGEIRVYISKKDRHDAMEWARKRFHELGMDRTRRRNGVLIYIVPLTQQFAIYGDAGINERCGADFWNSIVAAMVPRMKAGQFTEAIIGAVKDTGRALAQFFPPEGENPNELSNEIARD